MNCERKRLVCRLKMKALTERADKAIFFFKLWHSLWLQTLLSDQGDYKNAKMRQTSVDVCQVEGPIPSFLCAAVSSCTSVLFVLLWVQGHSMCIGDTEEGVWRNSHNIQEIIFQVHWSQGGARITRMTHSPLSHLPETTTKTPLTVDSYFSETENGH